MGWIQFAHLCSLCQLGSIFNSTSLLLQTVHSYAASSSLFFLVSKIEGRVGGSLKPTKSSSYWTARLLIACICFYSESNFSLSFIEMNGMLELKVVERAYFATNLYLGLYLPTSTEFIEISRAWRCSRVIYLSMSDSFPESLNIECLIYYSAKVSLPWLWIYFLGFERVVNLLGPACSFPKDALLEALPLVITWESLSSKFYTVPSSLNEAFSFAYC